jgi:hypothetical protein
MRGKNMHPNELVQVSRFLISSDAHILRGLLETEDIEAIVIDELFSSNLPIYPSILGGIKVFVPFKDFEQAKEIAIEYFKNIEESKKLCQNCDSTNIEHDYKQQISNTILNLVTAFVSGGFPFTGSTTKYKKCKDCGYKW